MSTPDRNSALNVMAFTGCVSWALGHDDMLAHYRQATGDRYTAPTNGLDAAIDRATGADRAFLVRFAEWVGTELWGEPEDVPDMDLVFEPAETA